jgi:hypothetical protein
LAEILSELLEPEHLNRRQDVEQSFLLLTEQLGFLPPELPHPRDEVAGLVLVGATFQQHRLDAPARGLLLGEQLAAPLVEAAHDLGQTRSLRFVETEALTHQPPHLGAHALLELGSVHVLASLPALGEHRHGHERRQTERD